MPATEPSSPRDKGHTRLPPVKGAGDPSGEKAKTAGARKRRKELLEKRDTMELDLSDPQIMTAYIKDLRKRKRFGQYLRKDVLQVGDKKGVVVGGGCGRCAAAFLCACCDVTLWGLL